MRTTLLAGAAVGVALLTASVADAATYRGKTRQGRAVVVRTDAAGTPTFVRINWRAPCRRGRYIGRSSFVPPFDYAAPNVFSDGGRLRQRLRGGFRARLRVFARGSLDPATQIWTGNFHVRAAVFRNGRRIDFCRIRRMPWRANLVQ
jgi:hypothetical protein